jgi:hypothetical protein
MSLNPLKADLNPICHLLALLGDHHIFHVSGLRVKKRKHIYIFFLIIFSYDLFTFLFIYESLFS